jgi:hypothetical protein
MGFLGLGKKDTAARRAYKLEKQRLDNEAKQIKQDGRTDRTGLRQDARIQTAADRSQSVQAGFQAFADLGDNAQGVLQSFFGGKFGIGHAEAGAPGPVLFTDNRSPSDGGTSDNRSPSDGGTSATAAGINPLMLGAGAVALALLLRR